MSTSTAGSGSAAREPNEVRGPLDETDRRILALLAADARMPNNAIAARLGIAASTCLARIRSLRQRGVIRGFHTDVDPVALGRGLQALISIRLHSHARPKIAAFSDYLASLSSVESIYFVTGERDFLVHVAVEDSAALRELVAETLSVRPEVSDTNTSVLFDYVRPGFGAS
ncbi:Lrp/AsnC family transcriptional regulator [Parafrigoribacterium soli]|uniref:Lrp/AsnC family transcriptional regulator n=1 Tax=Parafrigoribacterium soli TaxID=3144663 RepID=UPI0032F09310